MKIAIIGAGVSGLVAAHLLHTATTITVFEAGAYAGGHTNTVRVDTARRDPPRRHRLHRLQRPQLPQLRARCWTSSASRTQPSHMSFGVSRRRAATSSTPAPRPTGCSPSARTSCTPCVPPHGRRHPPLQPRGARRCSRPAADGPSLARLARRARLLARVRRAADRPAGRPPSGRPTRGRCGRFPARFLVEFFDNHGMLGLRDRPQWRTVARRLARATSRRSRARSRDRLRLSHAGHGDRSATTTTSRSRRAAASPSASTRSCSPTHSDQALRDARPTPATAERELLGAIPYQPNEAVLHTDRALLPAAPPRLGELELPPARRAAGRRPTVTYHMNRLQALRRRPRVLRDAQPHRGDRPRARIIRTIDYAHPVYTPDGVRRAASATREISGARPHPLLRRLLGLGLPRGRRRQRAARRATRFGGARCVTRQRDLRGHGPPPPLRDARATSSATGSRSPTSTSTSCPALLGGRLVAAAARRSCASAARDYLGDPAVAAGRRGARARRRAHRRAPRRADPAAHAAAHFGHCFNPVSFYYCFDATASASRRVVAEVTNTPWGERHAYVHRGRGDGARDARAFDKALHVSPFMGMDQRYTRRDARPATTLSVHIESQPRAASARSTRRWRCSGAR